MAQEAMYSKYETIQPNSRTALYEGELSIDLNNVARPCKGRIMLSLRTAPQVIFELQYPTVGTTDRLKLNDKITIKLPNSNGKGVGTVSGWHFPPPENIPTFTGSFDEAFETGDFAATYAIQFLVPNFPNYLGSAITRNGGVTASKMTVNSGQWIVEMEEVAGYLENEQSLNENGGFAITHIGRVHRVDGGSISYETAEKVINVLHWWLSFVRGERTGPVLVAGIHEEDVIWERWQTPVVHSWLNDRSWLPTRTPIDDSISGTHALGALFQYLYALKSDEREFDALNRAIDWYTQSIHERHIGPMTILAQAGIELLTWLTLVHDGRISEEGFEKLSAADQLRMTLSLAEIDRRVPDSLEKLRQAASKSGAYRVEVDGPGTVTEIRNATVHPKRKERFDDPLVMIQGGLLAIHYLELLILHRSGYQGRAMDRTDFDKPALTVPWGNVEESPS
jgi:hypothetical protein